MSIDVDNIAPNSLSRRKGEGEVLMFGVHCQVPLINGSLINGVRTGMIDHLAVDIQSKRGLKSRM